VANQTTLPTPTVKTAVIGASGFVGRRLLQIYRGVFADAVGTSFSKSHADLKPLDLRQPDLASLRLEETGHQAVLITAAQTDMNLCEREPEKTAEVNVRGILELCRQVSRTSMQVIFFSTESVFDGKTGDYDDDAPTNPVNVYGRQKEKVEQELPKLTDNYLILRLSKQFGIEKGDKTMLDSMASALAAGQHLKLAHDQVFCPTFVGDTVRAVCAIQAKKLRGLLNTCIPESWSRYRAAQELIKVMGAAPGLIESVRLHDVPGMENRALNTVMKCSRLQREVGNVYAPMQHYIEIVGRNWSKQ
jgi:dTDP-4-dehydrorhamnose reductase